MSRHVKQLTRSFAGGEMSPEMFSRVDDARYMNGVALLRNMVSRPQGTALRRSGSQFIRKIRDSATGKKVRLVSFTFAAGDTYAIEAGRATIDSREIGYFRFHTNGGTLLYDKPADYVASKSISSISGATITATSHGLNTGDPVTLSFFASYSGPIGTNIGTVNTTTNEYTLASASTFFSHGTPVLVSASTMPIGNGAALERDRIYFVHMPTPGNNFGLAETQYGTPIDFTSTGTTAYLSCGPVGGYPVFPTTIFYVIWLSANTFSVALTKAQALAGTAITWALPGTGDRRMHYAYAPGDIVYWTGAGVGSFVCMRTPWGRPSDTVYYHQPDHLDHAPPAILNYWCRSSGLASGDQRGVSGAVTCNATTDRIDWGSAHGLDNGEPVIINFSGSPAAGVINDGDVLYVRNKGTNDFEVSLTAFGPKVDLTSAGTSVTLFLAPYYDVPHYYTEEQLFKLSVAQSNDVLSLACNGKPAAELRRVALNRWERTDIVFGASVPAPSGLGCRYPGTLLPLPNGVRGQAHQVTVATTATPSRLDSLTPHQFAKNEPVYVFGLSAQGIPDGDYMTHDTTAAGGVNIYLADLSSGASVIASGTGGTGYVQPALNVVDRTSVYVVTSIDANGVESPASNEFSVDNNLFVPGAYNPISWNAVTGASRYRLYKKANGLFGMIGETDDLELVDDGIQADLSISPPLPDNSLLTEGEITSWNLSSETITWNGSQLSNGMGIVFETNDTLPTGIEEGTSYYVINAGPDTFQVSLTPGGSAVAISGSPAGQWWAKAGWFPGTVSYFEGRRAFGGSIGLSQDVWMTASGTESDMSYSLPTVDSDRIQFRVAVREAAQVRHIIPLSHLLLMASSSEMRVTPINDDALTPSSVSVRPQSYVGCDYPQPVVVNNVVVFPAARGGHVRELGFSQETNSYLTGDLSLRAAHLFDDDTIVQLAYQKAPIPTVWCVSSNGKLLAMTYLPDESIGSWHQHDTNGGLFESVVALAEGVEDVLYVAVKRGSTRFIERISRQRVQALEDCFYVDAGITYQGTATTTIELPPHFASAAVAYLADGVHGTATASAGAILTLPTAAAKVHVGLAITSQLRTIPLAMQVDAAAGYGRQKNINAVWARVFESGQFKIGPSSGLLVNSRAPAAGQLLSELVPVTLPGSWTDDGQVLIETSTAAPLNVTGLTIEVAAGG